MTGERVYVYLSYAGLYALNFDGTIAWAKPNDAQPMRTGWGAAASPALHDGRLYIVNDNEASSFIAAYEHAPGTSCGGCVATSCPAGRRHSFGRTACARKS